MKQITAETLVITPKSPEKGRNFGVTTIGEQIKFRENNHTFAEHLKTVAERVSDNPDQLIADLIEIDSEAEFYIEHATIHDLQELFDNPNIRIKL